jgi:hypothetical protein
LGNGENNVMTTLVQTQTVADEIDKIARLPVESAGVLLVSVVEPDACNTRLLARGIRWVKESAYERREWNHLSIGSEGYVSFLGEAERMGATPIWLHTHPGLDARPQPSVHDVEVDHQIAELFRLRSGSAHYGTLIVSPRTEGIVFTGYIQREGHVPQGISRIWEVGSRFRLTQSFDAPAGGVGVAFDRNVRAFGGAIQHALGNLRIGVVGCGGTGSAAAEQLCRLGVRRFLLIDPDDVSASNVTRLYGSGTGDVGAAKVDVVANNLKRIAPDTSCDALRSTITERQTAQLLCQCDIVLGCTDDNAGRLILSRFATYFLTPVIDCGVLLSSNPDGRLNGIHGRITTMVPGEACLVCRGRIDLARAGAELLTPEERLRRQDEGYAPALGRTEPAVVTFTSIVASTAVTEVLERFIGYGPEPRPSEVVLRIHDREISTNIQPPRSRHYCHESSGKLGRGMTEPFLEQTWPT